MKKQYRTLGFYKSSKGGYYTVKVDQDGGLSCNCPVWIYHPVNGHRDCMHLALAREEFGDKIQAVKDYGLSAIESPFLPVDY